MNREWEELMSPVSILSTTCWKDSQVDKYHQADKDKYYELANQHNEAVDYTEGREHYIE